MQFMIRAFFSKFEVGWTDTMYEITAGFDHTMQEKGKHSLALHGVPLVIVDCAIL